jgi:flagellar hook-length control protein FliK
MQTASVNTPAIIPAASTSATAGKAAETDTANTPFGQVLSKEVAQRGNADDAAPVASASKPAKGQATPSGTQADEKSDAAAATNDTAATEDAAQAQAATPADMLALMASMHPARDTAPAGKTAPGDIATGATESGETTGTAADARIAMLQQAAAATLAAQGQSSGLAQQSGKPDVLPRHAESALPMDRLAAGQRTGARQALGAKDGEEDRPAAAGKELKTQLADELRSKPADAHANTEEALSKLGQKQAFGTEFKEAVASAQAAVTAAAAAQQPAMVNAAQAAGAAAHLSDHIAPRVGTPGWDQAVAQKVSWMVAGDQQSASLTLNPPDLGPLQVVLNVTNSQADAAFTAAQPEVRQALEDALPRLREMLSDAGIQLGQATVSSGAPNQQGTPEQRQFQPTSRGDNSDTPDTQLRSTRVQTLSSGRGLVDTFA